MSVTPPRVHLTVVETGEQITVDLDVFDRSSGFLAA
jgi:hypothetical protein